MYKIFCPRYRFSACMKPRPQRRKHYQSTHLGFYSTKQKLRFSTLLNIIQIDEKSKKSTSCFIIPYINMIVKPVIIISKITLYSYGFIPIFLRPYICINITSNCYCPVPLAKATSLFTLISIWITGKPIM